MSASPTLVILAALTAGGVAGFGAAMITSSDPAETTADPAASAAVDSLRREVERLSDEQSNLLRQLKTLEMDVSTRTPVAASASGDREPLEVASPQLAELQRQVAQLNARLGTGDEPAEPMALQTVSAALEQIRTREDEERRVARTEARKEREAERVEELAADLALDGYQKTKMTDLVSKYGAAADAIIDASRKSGDWGGVRKSFETLHGEIDKGLNDFLTPTQLEELAALGGARALSSSGWGNWGRSRRSSSGSNSTSSSG